MNGIYSIIWYGWAIAHHLGHHLCRLFINLWKILGDICSAMLLIKEDFLHFLCDLDQGFIYIGDCLYTGINVSVQSTVKIVHEIGNLIQNIVVCSGNHMRNILKKAIMSLCGGIGVIRNGIIWIGHCLCWCLTLLPRLFWNIARLLLTTIVDAIVYLQKTIIHEIYAMITDVRFIFSAILILFVVYFLWYKRWYSLQCTMRLFRYFKTVSFPIKLYYLAFPI